MRRLDWLDWTAFTLVIIGGLNWGLVGLFNFNLVLAIFGFTASRVIYTIVGLAALYSIYSLTKVSSSAMMETKEQEKTRRAA